MENREGVRMELKDHLYIPETEGIDHINMYSGSQTVLGRTMSNFYRYPVQTDDGLFQSVEAYWFWLSIADGTPGRDNLRALYGITARNVGKAILNKYNHGKNSRFDTDFEGKIYRAIRCKLLHNISVFVPEYDSLPIVHYYCYSGKIVDVTEKHRWVVNALYTIREEAIVIRDKNKENKK